ncbi:MAG: acetate/propionate family kinase [Pseudomonadales bacterium]
MIEERLRDPLETGHHMLVVNAGSSSLRLASHRPRDPSDCLAEARLSPPPAADAAVLREYLARHALPPPAAVVHRIVHGGARLSEPCVIDAEVEAEIARIKAMAPLHNGVALNWLQAAKTAFGEQVTQIACFDTAFYRDLPAHSAEYALPKELSEKFEVRRYGFHGIAHQSMLRRWQSERSAGGRGRVISLQLGSGCSMTASDHGWPVETSMGFSPLEGLMMGSRCGDLDPAAVLHLIEQGGFSPKELGWILNESSGLRAVSRESADMRVLLSSPTESAALAVAMFCHRARHYLGAYLVALGGADAILFGGGIGENEPVVRARILENLGWAGVLTDPERNGSVSGAVGGPIHADGSAVEVWVTPPNEAREMALAARALLLPKREMPV